ncbi:MAG TPA: hypothetical protein EYQ63_32740 [Fuerstia sp.]|nr:hypothetical protein [Fuerstiella sp.]
MNPFTDTDGTDDHEDDETETDIDADYEREQESCSGGRAIFNLRPCLDRVLAIAHDPDADPLAVIAACGVVHKIARDYIRGFPSNEPEIAALPDRIATVETQLEHLLQEKNESAAGAER